MYVIKKDKKKLSGAVVIYKPNTPTSYVKKTHVAKIVDKNMKP